MNEKPVNLQREMVEYDFLALFSSLYHELPGYVSTFHNQVLLQKVQEHFAVFAP